MTNWNLTEALSFLAPVLAAAVLHSQTPALASANASTAGMLNVSASASTELEMLFSELEYDWPPEEDFGGEVPAVAVETLPADFKALTVTERKKLFFRILAPLVADANEEIRTQRRFIEDAFSRYPELTDRETRKLHELAERFNIDAGLDSASARQALLRRVDIVPAALVLAQAANESGWGTSRFAREANNLFGMWTWDEDAGLEPLRRGDNATHFVRVFDNLRQAVENYLHTINVGEAYGELRRIREEQRSRGEHPAAIDLAAGLSRYSARGTEYVDEIRSIIRYNKLESLPPLRLDMHIANNSRRGDPGDSKSAE